VNPPSTAGPMPSLTAAQAKKLAEDSTRRMMLARDYYVNPFLSSSSFFAHDAVSFGPGAKAMRAAGKPSRDDAPFSLAAFSPPPPPQSSPGNKGVTAYMHENLEPVWLDPRLGHGHPRRALPTGSPSAAYYMPPGVSESGFARAIDSSAGEVPGSGPATGPRPLPERLLWKNKVTGTGLGPLGVDALTTCSADMYQSIARVQMGRDALRNRSQAVSARYPTVSSGYAKQERPLIRAPNKVFGPLACQSYGAYGLGASSPALSM